jgi:Winged helix DNA-binding domain
VLMRGTIHLVTAEDALALRAVIQPVLDRELFGNRTWARGLEGVDLEPVLALGRDLVDERPRTLAELRDAMAERWPNRDVRSLAYAVRNLLPTLQVPPRGLWTRSGAARLTTLEAWTGRSPAQDTDPAPALRRYLRAFGPASVADMQAWSRLAGLRPVVEGMRATLRTHRDERGRELFDLPDLPLADPDLPAPIRFLPDYDNALLSHDDRSRIVPQLEWPALGDNVTAPIVLVDGFAAGIWRVLKPASKGERPVLAVQVLVPLGGATRAAIEAEAASLAAFLATATPGGPTATVQVTGG